MPHTSRAPRRDGKAHSELAASLKGALCDCGATETRRLPGDARGRPRNRARTSRAGVYAGRTVAAFRPFRTQPLRCLGNRQGHRGSRPGLTSLRPRHPPRRQPEPCAWSPYQAPQPSRRNPRPGAQLRCRDDAYILARRTGASQGAGEGVAGRNNGVQRRIAVSGGLIRPPRASAGERGSAGNTVGPPRGSQLAHTARQGGRRGGSQRGAPRHRDLPRAGGLSLDALACAPS